MLRIIRFCLSFSAVSVLLAVPQQPPSPPNNQTSNPSEQQTMAMPMPLVAPLFIENSTTQSVITLVSNSAEPVDVDITVSALSGDQLAKKTVRMNPHTQQTAKIADLLADSRTNLPSEYGSVSLVPDRLATLAAQLSITGANGSNSDIEEEFTMLMDSKPTNYRAVAGGLSAVPIVAIRSLGSTRQTVSITCLMEGGGVRSSSMPVAANGMLLVHACDERGVRQLSELEEPLRTAPESLRAAGISVSSPAPSAELAVFAVGTHGKGPSRTFFGIPFWDVSTLNSSTAIYPGVPTAQTPIFGPKSFSLRASVANFGSTPRAATLFLSSGSGHKPIATLQIPPNSVTVREFPEIPGEPGLASSISIEANGMPGEVITDIQANSDAGSTMSVPLPWKDQRQRDNGGQHPWTVADLIASTVILFNPDLVSTNSAIQLTIHAEEGTWTKRFSLSPSATTIIRLMARNGGAA